MALEEYGEYLEDYDYKPDQSHNTFVWKELVPVLIVYGTTMTLGLIGNILIIFTTYRYRRMQTTTNVLLSSLAIADLMLIIFCIPVHVAKLFSYTWAMGPFLCKWVYYIQSVSTICSVLTLTAISIERYYAIVHPMKAKYICTISQARKIIVTTWTLSFILAIPILFAQIHLSVGSKDLHQGFWCVRNWDNKQFSRFHELYMLSLVLILPFLIMTFAYSAICWEVWKVMEKRSIMTGHYSLNRYTAQDKNIESISLKDLNRCKFNNGRSKSDDNRVVKQVIYMLLPVVILFAFCWAPILIDNVLTAFGLLPSLRVGNLKHMRTTFNLLAYFNSCINPIIYGFMSKNFRESFQSTLCCSDRYLSYGVSNKIAIRQFSRTGSQTRTSHTSIR